MSSMTYNFDLFYIFLILVFVCALVFYLKDIIPSMRAEKERSSRRSDRNGRRSSRSKRRKGKRCPECRHIIDWRRTVCQHCGHKFEIRPGRDPHPDEIESNTEEFENNSDHNLN